MENLSYDTIENTFQIYKKKRQNDESRMNWNPVYVEMLRDHGFIRYEIYFWTRTV